MSNKDPLHEPVANIITGWAIHDNKELYLMILCEDGVIRTVALPKQSLTDYSVPVRL